MTTLEKLGAMRAWMEREGVDAVIVPNGDPHNNEYQAPRWLSREWLTGFKGSNGTVVVTRDSAGLWTDSRYYEAAEEALEGSSIELFRASDPGVISFIDWLKAELEEGAVVSFSGGDIPQASAVEWIEALKVAGVSSRVDLDPVEEVWTDRPAAPVGRIDLMREEYTGESVSSKIARVREKMSERKIDAYLLGRTDECNWLLNFFGTDMAGHPTPYCYCLVTHAEVLFFIDPEKLDDEALAHLSAADVSPRGYEEVGSELSELSSDCRLLMVPGYTNHALYQAGSHCFVVKDRAIVTDLKAAKNAVEIENFKKVLVADGAAMVRFYVWLYGELEAGRPVSELSASRKLMECREAIPGFRHVSFDSIMGYKAHGALNHYCVDEESDIPVELEGIFLIDSGGNFENGTSDTTRVIPMGEPTELQKEDYTLVLKCLIELILAEFPLGATSAQLDGLSRAQMWAHGRQFLHGTGHGVGYGLEVHEGPQNFSPIGTEKMLPGMVTTIEPGIYRSGEYGIRIENMVHTVESRETPFGKFMKFENLTFCPINVDLVIPDLLEDKHLQWLNEYNAEVVEKLGPLLNEKELAWLRHECRPVSS